MPTAKQQQIIERRRAALTEIADGAAFRVEITPADTDTAGSHPDPLTLWVWVANDSGRYRSAPDLELTHGDTPGALIRQLAHMVDVMWSSTAEPDDKPLTPLSPVPPGAQD